MNAEAFGAVFPFLFVGFLLAIFVTGWLVSKFFAKDASAWSVLLGIGAYFVLFLPVCFGS